MLFFLETENGSLLFDSSLKKALFTCLVSLGGALPKILVDHMGLYFFRSFIEDAALEEINGYLACSIHSTCQPAHTYSSLGDVMRPLFWALYNAKYNRFNFAFYGGYVKRHECTCDAYYKLV